MRGRFALIFILSACRTSTSSSSDAPDASASPQALAQPAQLAALPTTPPSATPLALEGGPPPVSLRADEVLPADAPPRDAVGYTLSAVLRPSDVLGPVRAPEVNPLGLDQARRVTELRLGIDLSQARMRITFGGHGFVLPLDAEIRARSDRYGHVVVWPGAALYRPLAPGSLRAVLGERRFDVAPITAAETVRRDDGGRRIGIRNHKVEVTTRAAKATFEIGKLEGAGEGGVLLCRFLLDLVNAPPGTALCAPDELPVHAELRWTGHGSLVFDLTGYLKRADLPVSALVVPPTAATFAASPLPVEPFVPILTPAELSGLRIADTDVPAVGDALVLINATLQLRLLYLDGVPVARVAPGARGEVRGLHRGRYVAQWRTFLGDAVEPAVSQVVPGVLQIGASPDAGH